MATDSDMKIYNSKYTGQQIDAGLDILYKEDNGIKTIPENVFIATNNEGKQNPIPINTIVNTTALANELNNYVTLNGNQTITGTKRFDANANFYQDNDYLSTSINGNGIVITNSGSQTVAGMGSLSLDWQSIQIASPNGNAKLAFGLNSSENVVIAFPPTTGTVALTSDIPTNYVTTNTEQNIIKAKTFGQTNSKHIKIDYDAIIATNVSEAESGGGGSAQLDYNGLALVEPTTAPEHKDAHYLASNIIFSTSEKNASISLSPDLDSLEVSQGAYIKIPAKSGTIALTNDIPSVSNLVNLDTEQTITGLKVFVGSLNIQGSNLNIAPSGSLVFNTRNNKKITFVLPTTSLDDNITITLPSSSKEMDKIGMGESGSTTLQLFTTDYTASDERWLESADNVDVEMGKYYFNITLGSGSTVVSVRTTSNYSLSENSVTALGTNQETWPEIKTDNRVIINPNGTKAVRVYSNAKIAGRTQIAYIQQS